MVKMYDFGVDTYGIGANERKPFAWPVAVWSCYIPESETQEINILEHLILQLVNKGYKDPKSLLCTKVGFNKDLVEASLESCMVQDYFDRRYKELTLSEDGKSMLGKYDNPYMSDLEASKKNKKIYMIQDLVTKSVIPVFDIDKLPQFYTEEESALDISYENFSGKKPRSASQKTAMRYWSGICRNIRSGVINDNNTIDISEPPEKGESIEEFIPFEDEVDWEEIKDDGNVKEYGIETLADKEEKSKQQEQERSIKNLTIIDDMPEIYYAKGYIAINRNAPEEVIILSPFGESLNNWFRTVINRLRTCNSDIDDQLQLFLMEKKDELKDSIAFGNELNITLFDEYPYICNDTDYKAVKKTIIRLTVSKKRFMNGEDDTLNFAQALRTAYEASFRLVVKKNPYLFSAQSMKYEDYKNCLYMLTNTYPFLSNDVYREYSGYYLYENIKKANENEGHTTAFFAMFLIDAWKDKNGKSMELLRNMPDLPFRIKELTSNLKTHNRKGTGNTASHGGDEIADLKFTEKKALQLYSEFENIFRAIYNRFMEGK